MFYELKIEENENTNYNKIIELMHKEGIDLEVKTQQGKNMFDILSVDTFLAFSANVAANVLANIIVMGLGKGVAIVINGIKVKTNSTEEVEQVIKDINEEL